MSFRFQKQYQPRCELNSSRPIGTLPAMVTLGIETSGPTGSVALLRDEATIGERVLSQTGRRHARTLVAELRELLKQNGVGVDQVDTVGVSIGPGSFTGLRVGVVCAKTFAYATRCAIVAVDTFQAIAAAAPPSVDQIDVIGDAQRGDLYVGRYERNAVDEWTPRGPIEIVESDAWLSALTAETVVSGPAASAHRLEIESRCRLLSKDLHHPRAENIARIAHARADAGLVDDVWTIAPKYIRRSAAEEKADAQGGSVRSE